MIQRALASAFLWTILASALPAAAADNADILLWNAVRESGNPAEYAAYLKAFPNGTFAALARLRLGTLPDPAPVGPTAAVPLPQPSQATAKLKVDTPSVRAIDRIAVDIDARSLRNDSNQRIVTVPASTPDAIDAETLAALGTPVAPTLIHTTLRPAPPGSDEVRLYTIPRFATSFTVAARAPVIVGLPPPGAVIVADLVAEAKALGAVGFEAKHRDVPLRVTGQYLRVTSGTSDPDWVALLGGRDATPKAFVVVYVGHLGSPATDGPSEVACILPADDRALLARLAALSPGDALVFDGLGSTWGAVRGQEFVVLDPCRLAA